MRDFDVVILADRKMNGDAGRPTVLTPLHESRTILGQQLENIRLVFGPRAHVHIVVGYRREEIEAAAPDATFVHNERYAVTNTARSLQAALRRLGDRPTLWLGGDLVFHPGVLVELAPYLRDGRNAVAVTTEMVSDEEMKYTVDGNGHIEALSKTVPLDLAGGEVVGINVISATDRPTFLTRLAECHDQDHFERGLEVAIEIDALAVEPVDVSHLYAVDVDTEEDLQNARLVVAADRQGTTAQALQAATTQVTVG